VFARSICGEGVPDFYAQRVLKEDGHCVSAFADKLLKPVYDHLGICTDINSFGFRLDENDDPLIEDC